MWAAMEGSPPAAPPLPDLSGVTGDAVLMGNPGLGQGEPRVPSRKADGMLTSKLVPE